MRISTVYFNLEMKEIARKYLLPVLYFTTLIYGSIVGYFDTFYGFGFLLMIVFQGLGIIALLIYYLVVEKDGNGSLAFAAKVTTVLQTILIAAITYDNYQPTYTIEIPQGIEGCVYLFTTPEERQDATVDQNGVGYVGSKGKTDFKVKMNGEELLNVLNTGHNNEILIYENNGKTMIGYNVWCLEISDDHAYPDSHADYFNVIDCMDAEEFKTWLNEGFIDESKLRKRVWTGSGNGKDWELDHERSRL